MTEEPKGRRIHRPPILSLFSGAGGLDWGFKSAGFDIKLAIDSSSSAVLTHKTNFPDTSCNLANLSDLGPNGVFELVREKLEEGSHLGIIGGPPCQGFSNGNTVNQENDPRNSLPDLYASIISTLCLSYEVDFVVFENVLGIKRLRHSTTLHNFRSSLLELGFILNEMELCASSFGVPQLRRRLILVATKREVKSNLLQLLHRQPDTKPTVASAISGLPDPVFFEKGLDSTSFPIHPNHWTMRPKSKRFSNPSTFVGGRSFKRLEWSKPSPTIAFGHREIHVHPDGHRRLSIFEAMLLQGFPRHFVIKGNLSQQVEQVSNAVPPPLGFELARTILSVLAD